MKLLGQNQTETESFNRHRLSILPIQLKLKVMSRYESQIYRTNSSVFLELIEENADSRILLPNYSD